MSDQHVWLCQSHFIFIFLSFVILVVNITMWKNYWANYQHRKPDQTNFRYAISKLVYIIHILVCLWFLFFVVIFLYSYSIFSNRSLVSCSVNKHFILVKCPFLNREAASVSAFFVSLSLKNSFPICSPETRSKTDTSSVHDYFPPSQRRQNGNKRPWSPSAPRIYCITVTHNRREGRTLGYYCRHNSRCEMTSVGNYLSTPHAPSPTRRRRSAAPSTSALHTQVTFIARHFQRSGVGSNLSAPTLLVGGACNLVVVHHLNPRRGQELLRWCTDSPRRSLPRRLMSTHRLYPSAWAGVARPGSAWLSFPCLHGPRS